MLVTDGSHIKRKHFLALVKKRVKAGCGSSLSFLSQRNWSFPVSNIREIIDPLPFVIIGGVATRLYMPERATLDLDILIKASDTAKVHQKLDQAGSQKIADLSISGTQWLLPDQTSLDVLEGDDDWIEEAISNPNYSPDGLPIIALPYLVLMKLSASRTQDLADISRMLGSCEELERNKVRDIVHLHLPSASEDLESLIYLGRLEIGI